MRNYRLPSGLYSLNSSTTKTTTAGSARTSSPHLKDLLGLILPSFKDNSLRIAAGLFALITVDLLQLCTPRVLKYGVDALAAGRANQSYLFRLALLILGIALAIGLLRFVWRYQIIGFSRMLERSIRVRIFNHILTMDASFFERHTTGDLMAHSTNDLSAIQLACGFGLVAAFDALVMSSAAIAFMVYIHPQLTLVSLLPMPFLVIGTRMLSSRLHRRFMKVQELFSRITEFSRSTMVSIRLIKAYSMEKFQTSRFDALGKQYVQGNLRVAAVHGLIFPIATLVGNLGMLLVLLYGSRLVIGTAITLGDFVAFISYLYMMVWPMMAIGWVSSLVQRGLTSLERIHNLLAARSSLPDVEQASPAFTDLSIRLENLTFHYSQSEFAALDAASLEFSPGIYGITGRTGSGKTTLCRILARLYPVSDGMYFCNNLEVNTLSVDFVRQHIAYVSQEPVLFSDTIAANISLGKPDASCEEIENAARQAAIHEDILSFPNGYQTLIGERGVRLSGGQRQRIALARALLCNRPVLLIDDGLAAVDVSTEHQIFSSLKSRLEGKITLIVSNRIKLLSMTDHIIILEEGRIANTGNHQQLLQTSSLYQTMYEKQMRQDGLEQ